MLRPDAAFAPEARNQAWYRKVGAFARLLRLLGFALAPVRDDCVEPHEDGF